ncbi:MAG: transposase [Ruminococcaceae bacterium]|nr:transposase [Oscillospiraceae bacterium]
MEEGMHMEYPKRKHPRLKAYDYSSAGSYFITVCTKDRRRCLCNIVGRAALGTPQSTGSENIFYGADIRLTEIGKLTDRYISSTSQIYESVSVNKYVIMPDHMHLLVSVIDEYLLMKENGAPGAARPTITIPRLIGGLKRLINKEVGEKVFQDSFYDHIIRNEKDYIMHWNYIEQNPIKWVCCNEQEPDEEDCMPENMRTDKAKEMC